MLWGTHVPPDTLGVTFFARLHSVPPNLLGRLLAARSAKAAQRLRNGSGWGPFGPPRSPRDALQTLLLRARGYVLTSGSLSPP